MKPIIYIYGNGDYRNYSAALTAAGAVPVIMSDHIVPDSCQALLLPGGGDIFGSLPAEETAVIRSFVESGRPILGICRGMQALNVYFGGTLYDDIPGHRTHGTDVIHATSASGLIESLLGSSPVVNSNHHQAVDRLGDGLVVCQRSEDGIIEAFFHETLPVLGVQWHPERESFEKKRDDAADAAPIFRYFLRLSGADES